MQKIFLLVVVLSFLVAAPGVLAQDSDLPSPGITPDSPFYFLKTWKESIQTFFTFGVENKAKQFLHLSEVRLVEYQKMIEKGKTEIAQKTLEKYEKQLSHALEKAEEAKEKGKDVEKLETSISERVLKYQEVLTEVLAKAPEQAKKGIEKAIEMSKKGYETAIEAVSEIKKEREKMEKECFEEGETYMPGDDRQCCAGLKGISLSVGDGRICSLTAGYVCTAFCGDGKCEGEYENPCSCPEDCPKAEEKEISCTENSDCGADTCQQGRDKCIEIKYVCENGECSGISKEYKNYSCAKIYSPKLIYPMNAKCLDTCGDGICKSPETKFWCLEDCPTGSGQEPTEEGPVVGGPCSYNTFKGECKIISILNENVIRYRFIPTEPLNLEGIEWAKKVIDREYYEEYAGYLGLKCLDKYPVTKEDLEKCNIKENAVLDCELEIITSGTCTPINVRFY